MHASTFAVNRFAFLSWLFVVSGQGSHVVDKLDIEYFSGLLNLYNIRALGLSLQNGFQLSLNSGKQIHV